MKRYVATSFLLGTTGSFGAVTSVEWLLSAAEMVRAGVESSTSYVHCDKMGNTTGLSFDIGATDGRHHRCNGKFLEKNEFPEAYYRCRNVPTGKQLIQIDSVDYGTKTFSACRAEGNNTRIEICQRLNQCMTKDAMLGAIANRNKNLNAAGNRSCTALYDALNGTMNPVCNFRKILDEAWRNRSQLTYTPELMNDLGKKIKRFPLNWLLLCQMSSD
uniref:Uncharacterized protein n=1 Tax=Romanomermis culicivorax TaxID=13658 RepID=A0A915IA50_ROMCU